MRALNLTDLAKQLDETGYRPGKLWAPAISLTQLVGGPLLALGLFTRPVAAVVLVFLLVSNVERWRVGRYFWDQLGLEYTLMWTIATFYVLISGPGPYSLDRILDCKGHALAPHRRFSRRQRRKSPLRACRQQWPVGRAAARVGGTLNSWDGVAPRLAEHFRVLRYDQRGAGLSEVRHEFTNDMLVEDFEVLAAALALPPPYHFVTVAAAATQALRFAEKYPDRVGALVLRNPAPGVDPSRAAVLDERAAFAAREGMRASLPTTLALSYPPQLGERAAYEAYLGRYLANDPVCFGFAFRALARTNMLHMLPKVRCPAMVVAGRHDTVRPHAGSAELAKKIPARSSNSSMTAGTSCRRRRRARSRPCWRNFCRDERSLHGRACPGHPRL